MRHAICGIHPSPVSPTRGVRSAHAHSPGELPTRNVLPTLAAEQMYGAQRHLWSAAAAATAAAVALAAAAAAASAYRLLVAGGRVVRAL